MTSAVTLVTTNAPSSRRTSRPTVPVMSASDSVSPAETGRQFAPLVIYNNDPKADRSLVMLEGEGGQLQREAVT